MSVGGSARALPTVVRVAFADALAYRAELFVWILSTTMPLIMLALFDTVAREQPIGRFGRDDLRAYFLTTFVVRQLTGSWVAWELNNDVRRGALSAKLLRPFHPLLGYAIENLAALPLRLTVALPVAFASLALLGSGYLPRGAAGWALWSASVVGGWAITFFANATVGCLCFFTESSLRIMDLWLVLFSVFSGYTLPVELFPPAVRALVDWLPFRYQLGVPVELATAGLPTAVAALLVAKQWAWVILLATTTRWLWRRGVARFAAYGG